MHKKMVHKFSKYIFFIFIIILNISQAQATPPSAEAQLILASGELVNSKEGAIYLLKQRKETITNMLSKRYPTFYITLPQIPKDWRESYIEFNRAKFLFENAIVKEEEKGYGSDKVYVPGKGRLFEILVPVVLKDSNYGIMNGKVIVRVDKNIKESSIGKDRYDRVIDERKIVEDIPVSATMKRFFVDETGNIYH